MTAKPQPADLLAHVEVLRKMRESGRYHADAERALDAAIESLAAHRGEVDPVEADNAKAADCAALAMIGKGYAWDGNRWYQAAHPPQAQAGAGNAEELQFYRDECALYRGKVDLLMAEVSHADEEGRAFIHKDTIVAIITHDPAVALEAERER